MVTVDEYLDEVLSPSRTIRAYLLRGTAVDMDAPGDVQSVTGLDGTVDEARTDWDALMDGRTSEGAVFGMSGTVSIRLTFSGSHSCPLTIYADGTAVSVTWRGSDLSAVETLTGTAYKDYWSVPAPSSAGAVLDVTVTGTSIRELVFGDAVPLLDGVTHIEWDEEQADINERWTVNELTVRMSLGPDAEDPVRMTDWLWLSMDVVCPTGTVRVPCGRWYVDDVKRTMDEAIITAYDARWLLNIDIDPDIWDGTTSLNVAELCALLGVPWRNNAGGDGPVITPFMADSGTWSEAVWRACMVKLMAVYVSGDGTVSTTFYETSFSDFPTEPPEGELAPLSRTMTRAMLFGRVSWDRQEYYDRIRITWPTGEAFQGGEGRFYDLILPNSPSVFRVPRAKYYPRYHLEWMGDPQWSPIDCGCSPPVDLASDIPGVPSGPLGVDRVEHVFDGGYRQRIRFYASRDNIPNP